jgi:LemA protein
MVAVGVTPPEAIPVVEASTWAISAAAAGSMAAAAAATGSPERKLGMQQQFETEAQERGFSPDEYREVVRRAQQIRSDKEDRISRDVLTESAAEVGIREEDLREAERQLAAERQAAQQQSAQQRRLMKIVASVAATLLALMLLFGYSSLNGSRHAVAQAQAALQSTLQRRADVVGSLEPLVKASAANEQRLVSEIKDVSGQLRSGDIQTQLAANESLRGLLQRVEGGGELGSSVAYRDLMAEISGSENRINVARTRYIAAATDYNRTATSFPTNLVRPLLGFPGSVPLLSK